MGHPSNTRDVRLLTFLKTIIFEIPQKNNIMKMRVFLFLIGFLVITPVVCGLSPEQGLQDESDALVIVWTSDDPYKAERMVLMYAHAAKQYGWFSEVTLIIWGPSAKLIAENAPLQQKLREMMDDGVVVEACVVCADAYNVTEVLRNLGYDVKPMGRPLTDYLKSDRKVLTF
jgi:hypothetical protein